MLKPNCDLLSLIFPQNGNKILQVLAMNTRVELLLRFTSFLLAFERIMCLLNLQSICLPLQCWQNSTTVRLLVIHMHIESLFTVIVEQILWLLKKYHDSWKILWYFEQILWFLNKLPCFLNRYPWFLNKFSCQQLSWAMWPIGLSICTWRDNH